MYIDILKKIDFFKLLNEDEIKLINDACKIITLSKNNILFYEGEDAKAFYILLQGNLKLYKTGTMGNEIVIHNFTKPTIFAEMATFQESTFPATAVSVSSHSKVAILKKDIFISLLKKNSNLSFHIIGALIKKMKTLEQTIHRNLVYDTTQRVCFLLKESPNILIEKKHSTIANNLNMAPATLSRTIKKLKDDDILDENNMIKDYSFFEILK